MDARARLVFGGQRSGKSRWAERQARQWLDADPAHAATLIATARADVGDPQMDARIARHRADRAERVPRLSTVEAPLALAEVITRIGAPGHLVLVDCLGLWLTNAMMPPQSERPMTAAALADATDRLLAAIARRSGPLLLVSNEIGLGVVPMGRETREFVDALGWLNQRVAEACDDVVLMVAGLPLAIKGRAE
ncbi:MAG: bifunctional adenosylcobinamide kinase/adenosylcobinamide-phosphate guanylyltransferase [Burkholderiaceae bacterium]